MKNFEAYLEDFDEFDEEEPNEEILLPSYDGVEFRDMHSGIHNLILFNRKGINASTEAIYTAKLMEKISKLQRSQEEGENEIEIEDLYDKINSLNPVHTVEINYRNVNDNGGEKTIELPKWNLVNIVNQQVPDVWN